MRIPRYTLKKKHTVSNLFDTSKYFVSFSYKQRMESRADKMPTAKGIRSQRRRSKNQKKQIIIEKTKSNMGISTNVLLGKRMAGSFVGRQFSHLHRNDADISRISNRLLQGRR